MLPYLAPLNRRPVRTFSLKHFRRAENPVLKALFFRELAASENRMLWRLRSEKIDCPYAGNKEISAAFHLDESWNILYSCAIAIALDRESPQFRRANLSRFQIIADYRISVVRQTMKLWVIDPGLLDKLKLTLDIRVHADEK